MTAPDLYAPFRPRLTVLSSRVFTVVLVVGAAALLVSSPGSPGAGYDPANTIGILALLALALWVVSRHGGVRADVTAQGLRVRNLVRTTVLSWPQVEAVRFGSGQPWVSLDLTDGTTLAVMAIQSADGPYGVAEARRLAALVQANRGL